MKLGQTNDYGFLSLFVSFFGDTLFVDSYLKKEKFWKISTGLFSFVLGLLFYKLFGLLELFFWISVWEGFLLASAKKLLKSSKDGFIPDLFYPFLELLLFAGMLKLLNGLSEDLTFFNGSWGNNWLPNKLLRFELLF